MKGQLKTVLGILDRHLMFERLSAHSILMNKYSETFGSRRFDKRELLWEFAANRIGSGKHILTLEFGVRQDYSKFHFLRRFTNPRSRFVGFDTFEGLPSKWGEHPPRKFQTDRHPPHTADSRVEFASGRFQNTVHTKLDEMEFSFYEQCLVHFVSDLYGSTLFILFASTNALTAFTQSSMNLVAMKRERFMTFANPRAPVWISLGIA